ncbi:Protein O-mannosyltransferase 2 [Coemansia sp. RSA 1694]|nr:Protein O-mannosyltransferase 2 [Coemansia sp. RSA 1694]
MSMWILMYHSCHTLHAIHVANRLHDHPSSDAADSTGKSRAHHIPTATRSASFDRMDCLLALALTMASLFTRLHQIGRRAIVSWDEKFFGSFGNQYINHTFYHDVHPPLAKMLVALSGALSGQNGSFAYPLGDPYPEHINYTFQRSFVAMFGVLIVPFAYQTCRYLGFTRPFACMAASFVLFDNALCVMSRFILLDAPLLCFTAMSLLAYAAFTAYRDQPFSLEWWRWLGFTGLSLGLVVSSKWIGLFAIALVGLLTTEELLVLYSAVSVRPRAQLKHWGARVICLIAMPAVIYTGVFQLHFTLLPIRGTGDYKMPSQFQALQRNSVVAQQPHDVAYGSQVTLRSNLPGFGLIHVNETFRFPDGDQECIAAGIGGKQKLNWWRLVSTSLTRENDTSPIKHVLDGDFVRFFHEGTGRWLRTGAHKPYHVGWGRRMFAGGNDTSPSLLDLWRVHVASEDSPMPRGQLYTVTTSFRLVNAFTGCALQATTEQLPQWGRRLSELICAESNMTQTESSLWNIEQVRDKRFKRANFRRLVKRRLLRNTIWINREMALTNSRLVADSDRYKHTESDPWSWPFLLYPMRLVSWADDSVKYYEVGNPLLWWASTLCCLAYPLQIAYWLARQRRQYSDWRPGELERFWDTGKLLWGGWALHYLPFFLMQRVTYIHHYLPALYFALLLLAFEIQCLASWYLPRIHAWTIAAIAVTGAGLVFCLFSPLTFGWDRPIEELAHLQWLPSWNLHTCKYDI